MCVLVYLLHWLTITLFNIVSELFIVRSHTVLDTQDWTCGGRNELYVSSVLEESVKVSSSKHSEIRSVSKISL